MLVWLKIRLPERECARVPGRMKEGFRPPRFGFLVYYSCGLLSNADIGCLTEEESLRVGDCTNMVARSRMVATNTSIDDTSAGSLKASYIMLRVS